MARRLRPDSAPIQPRIQNVGQLFHTLNPLPFRERDLDSGVEEYVVGWARETSAKRPLEIIVHLPTYAAVSDQAQHIEAAM
ncbi:MAG: hypothetical protein ACK56C_16885 [Alphaproteobacteria bacterium]|jgi:hypothetical protein